jgi:hypothetical protein
MLMSELKDIAEGSTAGVVTGLFTAARNYLHSLRQKRRLKAMLKDNRFDFGRTLGQLAKNIGEVPETTKRLLIEIGARPSEGNAEIWTLNSPPKKLG